MKNPLHSFSDCRWLKRRFCRRQGTGCTAFIRSWTTSSPHYVHWHYERWVGPSMKPLQAAGTTFFTTSFRWKKHWAICACCGGYQHQEKNCSAQALPHLPRDQFGLYCTLCSRWGHLSSTCLNEPSLQRDYQPRPPQSSFRTCDSSFQAGAQPQAPNQCPAYPLLNM